MSSRLVSRLVVAVALLAAGLVRAGDDGADVDLGASGADRAPAAAAASPPAPLSGTEPVEPSTLAPTEAPVVVRVRITLPDADADELQRLEAYLGDVAGKPLTPALVVEVSRRLDVLGRYRDPVCRPVLLGTPGEARTADLACVIRRARAVHAVRVETSDLVTLGANAGLPVALLESDLKKRVSLRIGEPLDDEDALGRGRIGQQRARIEDFLEREGYYGAQVTIDTERVGAGPDVDVIIRVRGGSFVRVRRVDVGAFGPISQRELIESYSRMCLTGEGLLDGVFLGNVTSCFNRRRLQATTERFLARLRESGHPEARVRVTPVFVDPRAPDLAGDGGCALSRSEVAALSAGRLPLPPRCVDLRVEVLAGPAIVTRFHTAPDEPGLVVEPPLIGGTTRWIRETFVEPSSRLLQIALGAPADTAADTLLVEHDLRARLTFEAAGSTDEEEARLSVDALREYLASRGHSDVQTRLVYQRYVDGDVAVDIHLRADGVTPVATVRIVAVREGRILPPALPVDDIVDGAGLAARPRTFASPGFISADELQRDVRRLREWYGRQGFPEADVRVQATRGVDGSVDVTFYVDEGQRFVLDRVIFAGGDPAVTADVLAAIAHCQTGRANAGRAPRSGDDCAGNPLLTDELDADARRVEAVYAARGYPSVTSTVALGFAPGPVIRITVAPQPPGAATAAAAGDGAPVRPLRVGQIFVEGNLATDREVLLREMGLQGLAAGERLDPAAIATGVGRLRRSGLFSRVDLELLGVDDGDDTAHVRVTVEERPSATVDLSLGFSTQQLFSLRLEGREKNLFGSMFDASAVADLGLFIGRVSQVRGQLRWPRVLGSDVSLSYTPLALTYRDEPAGQILNVPSTGAGQQVAAAWDLPDTRRRLFSTGTSVALDWRAVDVHPAIDDKLTLGVAFEARGDWLDVAGRYFEPFTPAAFSSLDGVLDVLGVVDPALVLSVTPRVAFSDIDNPFDPKTGTSGEFFVRTVPFALAPYAVIGAQTRGYWTGFADRLTLAGGARVRWGIAGDSGKCVVDDPQRCEWALMQNDLLRPGGDRSVRGVDENGVGVPGIVYDQAIEAARDAAGALQLTTRPGVFGAVLNGELRFTLIRQLFLGDLKPALFSDVGISTDDLSTTWRSVADVLQEPRLAVSVGAGLRYVLPVGPLAVDVAWSPFEERAGNELPVRISAALGYIF